MKYDLNDLVTLPEASIRLGFANAKQLSAYRARGHADWLPDPVATFGRADVFDMREIEAAWKKHRGVE